MRQFCVAEEVRIYLSTQHSWFLMSLGILGHSLPFKEDKNRTMYHKVLKGVHSLYIQDDVPDMSSLEEGSECDYAQAKVSIAF